MSKAVKAAEPTMDEILASIRKIIAEEPAVGSGAAPVEAPHEEANASAPGGARSSLDDILGMTDTPAAIDAAGAPANASPGGPVAKTEKSSGPAVQAERSLPFPAPVAKTAPAAGPDAATSETRLFFPEPAAAKSPTGAAHAREPLGTSPQGDGPKSVDFGAIVPDKASEPMLGPTEAERKLGPGRLPEWLSRPGLAGSGPSAPAPRGMKAAPAVGAKPMGPDATEVGGPPAPDAAAKTPSKAAPGFGSSSPSAMGAERRPDDAKPFLGPGDKAPSAERNSTLLGGSPAGGTSGGIGPMPSKSDTSAAGSPTKAGPESDTTSKPGASAAASSLPDAWLGASTTDPSGTAAAAPDKLSTGKGAIGAAGDRAGGATPGAQTVVRATVGTPNPAGAQIGPGHNQTISPRPGTPAAAGVDASSTSGSASLNGSGASGVGLGAPVPGSTVPGGAGAGTIAPHEAAAKPFPAPAPVPVAETTGQVSKPSVLDRSKPVRTMSSSDLVATVQPAGGVRTLDDTIVDLLRPMIRQWLDENMPRMVEKALRIELAASLQAKGGLPGKTDTSKH